MIFRQRDLIRPSAYAALALVPTAALGFGFLELTALGTVLLGTLSLVLLAPALVKGLRSYSRVGADGITIGWGFGPGRTHSWQQIRWVGVQGYGAGGQSTYVVQVHLADGRRRSLPGLHTGPYHQATDFVANAHRVSDYFEASTDPARRVEPQGRSEDWVTPLLIGIPLGLALLAAGCAIITTQHR